MAGSQDIWPRIEMVQVTASEANHTALNGPMTTSTPVTPGFRLLDYIHDKPALSEVVQTANKKINASRQLCDRFKGIGGSRIDSVSNDRKR